MIDKIYLVNLLRRYIVMGMTFEELKIEAKRLIKKRNDNLERNFEEGDYETMAKLFTEDARVVRHDGEVIPGKDSKDYWETVAGMNGTNLKFIEKYFDAVAITNPSEEEENPFDFVAIDVTEFNFTANGQVHNGYIDPPLKHRRNCDWH
jgi:hypothetical protein